MIEGNFEARKIGMRQNKEGVIISFVVQPDDFEAALAMVPIGARVMIGWAQIGDNEKPIELEVRTTPPTSVKASAQLLKELHPSKSKERFEDLPLVKQCVLRCGDEEFMNFFDAVHDRRLEESLADAVRRYCAVASRAEIKPGTNAAKRWLGLEHQYQNWLTDQKYGQVRR